MPSPYLMTPMRTLMEACQGMAASGAVMERRACRGCSLRALCIRLELTMRGRRISPMNDRPAKSSAYRRRRRAPGRPITR